jgi:hypothetical protein
MVFNSDVENKILFAVGYVYIVLTTILELWHLSTGDVRSTVSVMVTQVMVIVLLIAFIRRWSDNVGD